MCTIYFNMNSSAIRSPKSRMTSKDEFFGLEVKQLWSFEQYSDRFLFDLLSILNEVLDNFEVDLFVFDE